jgi:polyribonucleotide nucleotidyltransferase
MMQRILAVLPKEQIFCVSAEREFIGHEWFQWLRRNDKDFSCRIRTNTRMRMNNRDVHISTLFTHLALKTTLCCGRINPMGY